TCIIEGQQGSGTRLLLSQVNISLRIRFTSVSSLLASFTTSVSTEDTDRTRRIPSLVEALGMVIRHLKRESFHTSPGCPGYPQTRNGRHSSRTSWLTSRFVTSS